MEIVKKSIPNIFLIKPKLIRDNRGYFIETFRQDIFELSTSLKLNFCQENETRSKKYVLRGLHFQIPPFAQSKLVRVILGEILDVAVDIRFGSPTFGKYIFERLSSENKHQLFIPRGFAHGFLVLSEYAIVSYKVDNYYSSSHEFGLFFNDPDLNLNWGFPVESFNISEKDINLPNLKQIKNICLKFNFQNDLYD